eukprot:SAG11_NODE_5783_length_1465_cov_0.834553_2_plen_75_part_00
MTEEKIAQAKDFTEAHMGNPDHFNEAGWRYILEKHGGRLPLVIKVGLYRCWPLRIPLQPNGVWAKLYNILAPVA